MIELTSTHAEELARRYFKKPDSTGTYFDNPPAVYNKEDFIAVPVKQGDAILLHGHLVHESHENNSTKSRWAFTLHIVDGIYEWPATNWLQRPAEMPFQTFDKYESV